jgi:hypothetical protein
LCVFGLAYHISQVFYSDGLILPGISPAPKPIRFFGYRETGHPGNARSKAMVRTFKVMLVALVVLVLAGSAYAFAAANTVQASAGGYLSTTVSGYAVTDLKYDLHVDDPTMVDKITFSISPTSGSVLAATVKIQTSSAGLWTECSLIAGTSPAMLATCSYTDPNPTLTMAAIDKLNVVASSTIDPTPIP